MLTYFLLDRELYMFGWDFMIVFLYISQLKETTLQREGLVLPENGAFVNQKEQLTRRSDQLCDYNGDGNSPVIMY